MGFYDDYYSYSRSFFLFPGFSNCSWHGDIVVFTDNVSDIEYAPNGSPVVVNYEDRMIVRCIFRKGDRVILKAWNKLYGDIVVTPEDEFRICGLVLKIYPDPKKPRSML
jgi:SOS-response transcriptional repressor LexA